MNSRDGLILWTLGAAGTLLVYAAYKNTSPASILAHYVTPDTPTATLGTKTANATQADTGYSAYPPARNEGEYTARDSSGIAYLYNAQGYQLARVPSAYQTNPASWIPSKAVLNA
jgi:hypothetical protein